MSSADITHPEGLFQRVRIIANPKRFTILLLTQNKQLTITELSSKIGLAYNKCSDYVNLLENNGLVKKERIGKEAKVLSKVKLSKNKVEFPN